MKLSRIDLVWASLLAATATTWALGESGGGAAWWPMPLVFTLAAVKAAAVALDFMGLAGAPPLWRRLVLGWVFGVVVLVLLAWWLGRGAVSA
ncbi:cytochrome C oxidase subunit IV family protein [Rubrivivax sp. JA1024]|nr:cytochrome C oxidase subunit IV family protein [Rubrivivax sp. JA1024]